METVREDALEQHEADSLEHSEMFAILTALYVSFAGGISPSLPNIFLNESKEILSLSMICCLRFATSCSCCSRDIDDVNCEEARREIDAAIISRKGCRVIV